MIGVEMSEEQELLRRSAAKLASEVYGPNALVWDRERTFFPDSERKRLARMGFLGICLSPEYGGGGAPLIDALIVIEELAKECQLAAFQVFEANTGPARVIDLYGTADQKAQFLPPIINGDATLAVSISEPDAGSAATDVTTAARLDDHEFVITGAKRWCSGGGHSEFYLVYARINDEPGPRGIGALVVPGISEGLTFGPQERLMGFHGIPSADMFFDGVRVPEGNLIVTGFKSLFNAFSIERLGNTTMSVAIGQACLDRTARYIQDRHQFGKPIAEFQSVQTLFADMVMQVEAARLLLYRAALNAGSGAPSSLEASVAKCFANEMAKKVSDIAMGLHGGYGYSEEYGIERYHRDAHGWALGGGTPTIQRTRIAAEYLGRSFNQRS